MSAAEPTCNPLNTSLSPSLPNPSSCCDSQERARGVGSTAAIRGLQRICGMYMYPVDTVLLPTATLQGAPTNLLSGAATGLKL